MTDPLNTPPRRHRLGERTPRRLDQHDIEPLAPDDTDWWAAADEDDDGDDDADDADEPMTPTVPPTARRPGG